MTDKEIAVLNYINLKKIVKTHELSRELSISESTVRRILCRLDRRKLIVRFHGGATAIPEDRVDTPISARLNVHTKEKELIARKAAEKVTDGSTIIMLGGTTVFYMCKYLKGKSLTVVTNSLIVLDALKYEKSMQLVLLGGVYNNDEAELRGSLTSNTLRKLSADYLFTSATAFEEVRGFLTSHIDSIELYNMCFQVAQKVFMLVDSSKYRKSDVAVTARCEDIDCLICDSGLPVEARIGFANKGVEVIIVE
ncbi:MAG TPA: DeoR/GlpR transcriptional regulator [Clostridiaceae bacterium]|nr:DeoR/GlpR transcriptional regulator [Clostridiaceae bacterium]